MLIADSLCLKSIDPNNLLVAVGNQLHYYSKCNKTNQCITTVLTDVLAERIHGIEFLTCAPQNYRIVCHGGKEIAQLVLSGQMLTKLTNLTLNDWISSAHIYAAGSELALLTSHGVATRMALEWNSCDGSTRIQEAVKCPDKSTLYCSLIVDDGHGWPGMTFFGGTAFGQLIVWRNFEQLPRILIRVDCHNGVILSINCNLAQRIVTTTSDDRSIKVWRFEHSPDDHSKILIRPRKTLFGHTGRVFRCKLIVSDSKLLACTAGEDQNLCLWNLETGHLLHRQPLGASLWHIDYEPINQIIYASGADGNYKQLEIGHILDATNIRCLEMEKLPNMSDDEHIAKVRFLQCGYVAVVTNYNRILCGNPDTYWSIPVQTAFKISLLETSSNQIAVAGYNVLSVYEYDIVSHSMRLYYTIETMNEMIRSFHFLSTHKYFVCGQSGQAMLISQFGEPTINARLPPSKEPWATAVLDNDGMLFVGDRSGHLHLFELSEDNLIHRDTVKHMHGRLGCTSLQVDSDCLDNCQKTIISAGHDGTIKLITLNMNTKSLSINYTINVPIAWIQNVFSNATLIAGFNSNKFVIWNQDRREVEVEIECGGGHRYSDLYCPPKAYGDFVFLRNKTLKWIRFKRPNIGRLVPPKTYMNYNNWHSLSCTTVVAMPTYDKAAILFSGGDDNLLKIHICDQRNNIQNMANIFSHVSSIKTLSVQTIDEGRIWKVFSAGGRAQICVTQIEILSEGSVRVTQVADFMLRMSDYQRKRLGTANAIDFNPETRFMSLAFTRDSEFFVGCSDGFIRQFEWTGETIALKSSVFYGKCVLKVDIIERLLVSAATDGNICFWNAVGFDPQCKPIAVINHHGSGIQSMDWIKINVSEFQIVTGGDDQRVVLSTFEITDDKKVRLIKTSFLDDVHTAQVNGVIFTKNEMYSTGVDQTIFQWNRSGQRPHQVAKSCVADIKGIIQISNISGIEQLMVYGHGVQSFEITNAN